MKTIEVTTRRRIEVPDDQLAFNKFYLDKGEYRVDTTKTVRPLLAEGDALADAFVIGEIVMRPDADEQRAYEASLDEWVRMVQLRDAQRLLVSDPESLPTDYELLDHLLDKPVPVPTCSECGSTTFRYDENVGYGSTGEVETDIDGNVAIHFVSSRGYEGDGYPGVMCDNCNVALDYPENIDIEFG